MRITLVKLELVEQNKLLLRIAEALERMAPPLPAHEPPPHQATISDLRTIDPEGRRMLDELEKTFAEMWNVEPGSEAYRRALEAFEKDVFIDGGQEAVDALPWNSIGRRI